MGKVILFDRRARRSAATGRGSTRDTSPGASIFHGTGLSVLLWASLGLAAIGIATLSGSESSGCVIKGNISVPSGERIFHVPGQDYYGETRISLAHGERWFCSEADARAAGWRRALR